MRLVKKLLIVVFIFALLGSCQNGQEEFKRIRLRYPDGPPKRVEYLIVNQEGDSILSRSEDFYSNGQLYMSGAYDDEGRRKGYWKSWRKDGTLWSEAEYKEGKMHGLNKAYHENGQLYIDGRYEEGEETGTWKFYDPKGRLVKEVDF